MSEVLLSASIRVDSPWDEDNKFISTYVTVILDADANPGHVPEIIVKLSGWVSGGGQAYLLYKYNPDTHRLMLNKLPSTAPYGCPITSIAKRIEDDVFAGIIEVTGLGVVEEMIRKAMRSFNT